jgi:hypothetical protein
MVQLDVLCPLYFLKIHKLDSEAQLYLNSVPLKRLLIVCSFNRRVIVSILHFIDISRY